MEDCCYNVIIKFNYNFFEGLFMFILYYKCRYLNVLDIIKYGYNMVWIDKCIEYIIYNLLRI